MKRILSFALMAAFLLCLCACANGNEPTEPSQPHATTVPQTTAQKDKDPQLGEYANGVYINEFLDICCQVDSKWKVYSDAELAQLNGLVLDTMTDKDLVEQRKKANIVHLFYAAADQGHQTVNILLENAGTISSVLIDEKAYAELSVEQMPAALESVGLTDVIAKASTIRFAGAKHAVVVVHATHSGVDFYEKIVCIKVGSYFGVVTVASYHTDLTDELLGMFGEA